MEFKDILRELRTEREWSQTDVAKRLGKSVMLISQYETGKRKPSFEMLEALADLFHVDMNYLLGHTDAVTRLSGDETDPAAGMNVLISVEENDLIYAWRHADDQTKRIVAYALGLMEGGSCGNNNNRN